MWGIVTAIVVALANMGGFTDVAKLEPSIRLDIRYATTNNFAKTKVYPAARCLLRRDVARRLVAVHRSLRKRGLGLKIWDCYRPFSVQQRFWKLVPDARYVARPVVKNGRPYSGSKHNRGAAVDLTVVDRNGVQLEMPTDYDDFSNKAHRGYTGASKRARRNAALLERAMVKQGFTGLATEWWHFDGPNWQRYPLANIKLTP